MQFERTNGVLALQARNQLNGCKYVDGHLQSHLDMMSKLWEDALAVGVKILDDEFCHILRLLFPPGWAFFLTTLITINDPIVLEASLLAFADLQGQSSKPAPSSSTTALISSVTSCTNFGKNNHTVDWCYWKGGGAKHTAPHTGGKGTWNQ